MSNILMGSVTGERKLGDRLDVVYTNPLSRREVAFAELFATSDDVVWVRRKSRPYDDLRSAALFHDQASRPICDTLDLRLPAMRSAQFVLGLNDCHIAGYRTYVGAHGNFCLDEARPDDPDGCAVSSKLTGSEQFEHELSGIRSGDRGRLVFDVDGRDVIELDQPVISLTSDEAPNFGSFLTKILPKMVDIARMPQELKILTPIYTDSVRDFLHLCGIPESRIIHQDVHKVYHAPRVYVPSIRNADFYFDGDSRGFYDMLRLRYGDASRPRRRIYISRSRFHADGKAFHNRRLMNEEDVIDLLMPLGFEVICPEMLGVMEQIRVFSSAACVVGVSGSGLFNTVFSHPGTTVVDIESEPHWFRNHCRLFQSLDMRFGIFEASSAKVDWRIHHHPFNIDIERLSSRLKAIGLSQSGDSGFA